VEFTLVPFADDKINLHIDGDIEVTRQKISARYRLTGDMQRVRWPQIAHRHERTFELWATTCFEFFIGPRAHPAYFEFNLSPSGDWNSFAFSDIRTDMAETARLTLHHVSVHCDRTSALLGADIDFQPDDLAGPLDIGVSAVIETVDGRCHYFALAHPGKRPDFHARQVRLVAAEI